MPPMPTAQDDAVQALREYAGIHGEITRAFAASLGLHHTDAAALVEIILSEDGGSPVSPAALARRIGASPSAMSACINRLEAAGMVKRQRLHADRRIVALTCDKAVYAAAGGFFQPISDHVAIAVGQHGDDAVRQAALMVRELGSAMRRGLPKDKTD